MIGSVAELRTSIKQVFKPLIPTVNTCGIMTKTVSGI